LISNKIRDCMWPSRQMLDVILLSLVKGEPIGLTAYALVKKLADLFKESASPSPGTIYPRLKKLVDSGDLTQPTENTFQITNKGAQFLAETIPRLFDDTQQFCSILSHSLLQPLPIPTRIQYLHRFGDSPIDFAEIETNWGIYDANHSIRDLETIKEHLLHLRDRIQSRTNHQLQKIETQIAILEKKLQDERIKFKTPKVIWS